MWTPPVWLGIRKIFAVNYNLTYLKALLTQIMASLSLGWSLENFMLDEISTSIHSQILDEISQTKSFIKRTYGGDDANRGS